MDEKEWFNKGNGLAKLKRYEEAIKACEEAIEINPKNDKAWVNKGFYLAKHKRYKEAIKAYKKAIKINPE